MAQAHLSVGRGGSLRKRLSISSLASRRRLRRSEVLSALRDRPDRGLTCRFVIFGWWRGSTITQQLVKNVFLKDERKICRKFVEILLALILERNMSKWKLLCSYLSKIYWGHGVYGIESASTFYFGKHPSLLSLGESAMLVGIIPAPERLSPLRDPSRGIASQARALRRMVEAGFLDIETALLILKEPLCLRVGGAKHVNGLSQSLYFSSEESGEPGRKIGRSSVIKEIWDWEKASSIWEVREYMEEWEVRIKRRNAAFLSIGKST